MTQSQGGLLPLEQVTSISDYLPTTSRICFAIALTAPSESFRQKGWQGNLSTNSKAVLSSKEYWELDFVDLDKYYKSEPSDGDLHALLMYIDAKNTLKSLRFKDDRHQYNNKFTASGLRALTGSTVLESLTLPLHFSNTNYASKDTTIIPIICSIMNAVDNPLDRLDLMNDTRRHWMRDGYNGYYHKSPLREVLETIQLILRNHRPTICGDCENAINGACFTCFRICCSECERPCDNCHLTICYSCELNCRYGRAVCERCETVHCSACAQLRSVGAAVGCDYCEKVCFECASTGGIDCTECPAGHFTKMRARSQAQAVEINGLTEENEHLRREIEELRNRMRSEL